MDKQGFTKTKFLFSGDAGTTDEIEHNIVLSSESEGLDPQSESEELEQRSDNNNDDSDIEVLRTLTPVQRRRPRRRY